MRSGGEAGAGFETTYTVEMDRDLPSGQSPVVFDRGILSVGEVVIRIVPEGKASWFARVVNGPPSVSAAMTGVGATPHRDRLYCVAKGEAWIIDAHDPDRSYPVDTSGPVVDLLPVVTEQLLILATPWTICALDAEGVRWGTSRLAVDGVRLDTVEHGRLLGVADPGDDEAPFWVDLDTGSFLGGNQPGRPRGFV